MIAMLSRLISPFVAALIIWLAGKGVEFGTDAEAIINGVTLFVVAILMALYGIIHKWIDKRIHPADDAR